MKPADLVDDTLELLSLPEVCMRVNAMIDNPRYSVAHIGDVINQDVALTARLLKLVNSSLYAFPSQIDTVSRAITVIGMKDLRDLIISTATTRSFDRLPLKQVDMTSFWRHSVYTAVVAKILAQKCNILHSERLFIGGLLHDVGHLVMYYRIPETMYKIYQYSTDREIALYQVEKRILGFNYADVGMQLLKSWKLPVNLQKIVQHHITLNSANSCILDASIVHLASNIAREADLSHQASIYYNPIAWEVTQLSKDDILEGLLVEAGKQFSEVLAILAPQQKLSKVLS